MANAIVPSATYDVVIVGSGAGGGVAAQVLANAGAKICMLKAGAHFDCTKHSKMFEWAYQAPIGARQLAICLWDISMRHCWAAGKCRGSRTLMPRDLNGCGGGRACLVDERIITASISLRMGPYDFKPYSRDGKGADWPIAYDDLAPYYDKAEELIGVFGSNEGLENAPDGKFQPPPAPRGYEKIIKAASDKLRIPCVPSRLAILTRPLNGRPACHYCAE